MFIFLSYYYNIYFFSFFHSLFDNFYTRIFFYVYKNFLGTSVFITFYTCQFIDFFYLDSYFYNRTYDLFFRTAVEVDNIYLYYNNIDMYFLFEAQLLESFGSFRKDIMSNFDLYVYKKYNFFDIYDDSIFLHH